MKARVILVAVLVVAVALVGCTQAQKAPESAKVSGSSVSAGQTRLWTDAQKSGDPTFTVDSNGKVYQGTVQTGQAILFFDGSTVFRGANSTGEKLFTVGGETIFVGGNTNGPAAYTVTGNKVYEGKGTQGAILYNIDGERLREGANATGSLVFQANTNLTGSVQFLLPILADRRF
ncbi:MAG: hypothetical protein ACE5F6_11015 [Anaerolineae bacterium]